MEHSRVKHDTTHVVVMALEGGEEDRLDTGYGSGFQIEPYRLRFTWLLSGPDAGWILREATVTGSNVLKSGKLGNRVGSRDFEVNNRLTEDAPSWLVKLERQYQPSELML